MAAISCKKEKEQKVNFQGVWVENILGVDTLDFDAANQIDYKGDHTPVLFKTNFFTDTIINPFNPKVKTALYDYYFNSDSTVINLKSLINPGNNYGALNFQLLGDRKKFTIDRFYPRYTN